MIILTENTKDPIRRLEMIIESVYQAKFPNDASIINDKLRGRLHNAYDINLNMCDTHHFRFASNDGTMPPSITKGEPEEYYIYEGDGNKNLLNDGYTDIHGIYPEGILLGFLDSGFRDKDYIRKNIDIYFSALLLIGKTFMTKYNNDDILSEFGEAYKDYIKHSVFIFALKQVLEKFHDFKVEEFNNYADDDFIKYFIKDRSNFLKVISSYDYSKIYKYIHKAQIEIIESKFPHKDLEEFNKYEKIRREEKDEIMKSLVESSEDIISNILDDHAIKLKNDLDENKNPKSGREFHVYMYNCFEDEDLDEIGLCIDAKSTKTQIDIGANYIYTTNTHYVSTDLIRNGYRIFIHLDKDTVREIKIGDNDWTDREIKWVHKLETFLYNGEMK